MNSNSNNYFSQKSSPFRKRPPRPPGLKGKAIGLYYRDLKRNGPKKEKEELKVKKIKISDGFCKMIRTHLPPLQSTQIDHEYNHIGESSFKRDFLHTITSTFENRLDNDIKELKMNENLNEQLKENYLNQLENEIYKERFELRKKLPSFKSKEEIMQLINMNNVIVISGETGCGKTTQVPQYILDEAIVNNRGSTCNVVCTQPRRISAISVAERVAYERAERLGESTGFAIRLESKYPRESGSILYCTTGYLLQVMRMKSTLNGVSHLIMDEVHERDTQCDILLAVVKEVIPKRPDLKVILMSATLNADKFSTYFNNCPHIQIPGFTYPVAEYFLEDIITSPHVSPALQKKISVKDRYSRNDEIFSTKICPYVRQFQAESTKRMSTKAFEYLTNPCSEMLNIDLIYALIMEIKMNKPDGAILVFLPSWVTINDLYKKLTDDKAVTKDIVIPLHSKLPTVEQKHIFNRPPPGVRKIILSTNIAETSITIDDVVYVIDSGKAKLTRYDDKNNIESIQDEWVSLANANQRKGRAGRVQPGECYHLYTRARHELLDHYPTPEILRSRLDEVILKLKLFQISEVTTFFNKFIDVPKIETINHSLNLLKRLNALDDEERLTPLGYHLAHLPINPRCGKMIILSVIFSCVDPILSIAASLAFKDPFYAPLGKDELVLKKKLELSGNSKSDHLLLADAFRTWETTGNRNNFCYNYFLSDRTLSLLKDMKQQFADNLRDLNLLPHSEYKHHEFNKNASNRALLKAIICAGLFPNIATVKKVHKRGAISLYTPEDGRVQLFPMSINAKNTYFDSPYLAYHSKMKSSCVFLHDSTMVHVMPILLFADQIEYVEAEDSTILSVKDIGRYSLTHDAADLIIDLRKRWNILLEYKVAHPGYVNWNCEESDEVKFLSKMVHLINLDEDDALY